MPAVSAVVTLVEDWPEGFVREQLANAEKRFADCHVSLTFTRGRASSEAQFEVRFIQSLAAVGGKPIEGRSFNIGTRQIVEIAWADAKGEPLDHKQTLVHELGHASGLGHASLHTINLMAPHGCIFCHFSQSQCRLIQGATSPLPDRDTSNLVHSRSTHYSSTTNKSD